MIAAPCGKTSAPPGPPVGRPLSTAARRSGRMSRVDVEFLRRATRDLFDDARASFPPSTRPAPRRSRGHVARGARHARPAPRLAYAAVVRYCSLHFLKQRPLEVPHGAERIRECRARHDRVAGRASRRRRARRRGGRREPRPVRRGPHPRRRQAALARGPAGSRGAGHRRPRDLRAGARRARDRQRDSRRPLRRQEQLVRSRTRPRSATRPSAPTATRSGSGSRAAARRSSTCARRASMRAT